MERRTRPRSKTKAEKKAPVASPRPKRTPVKKKESPEPERRRSRGRPPKKRDPTPSDPSDSESPSRSRSRSRSVSITRRNYQTRQNSTNNKEANNRNDKKLSQLAGIRGLSIPLNADDINKAIRRSLSRDLPGTEIVRKSKTDTTLTTHTEYVESITRKNDDNKLEFGGCLGVVVHGTIIFFIVFAAVLGCTREQCSIKPFHVPRNWRVYISLEATVTVVSFILGQTLLAILLPGRIIRTSTSTASYRANGFLALLLTGGSVAALWYAGYPVTRVYEWFVPLAMESCIISVILALGLYGKSRNARLIDRNLYGNSGNIVYDFYVGREVNPMIYNINVKIVLRRVLIIAQVLIDALFLLKAYEVRKQITPTLATLVGLNVFNCLDTLWFEELFVSSFESQYEAVGLMSVERFLLWPFFKSILTRFVLAYNVSVPVYHLVISVAIFLVGFYIYRQSNLQKATLRANPSAAAIANLDTIQGNRIKRLLVSGWWGLVKHPNYLGDIIMAWAAASTIGFTHALPYVVPLVFTVFLLHRAKRDERRCRVRYGETWEKYDERVPYLILPRVY